MILTVKGETQAVFPNIVKVVIFNEGDIVAGLIINKQEDEKDYVELRIGQLDEPVGVGNKPPEAAELIPEVVLAFGNIDSLDVVISWLKETRKAMIKLEELKLEELKNVV